MKILNKEIALREETRAVQQARAQLSKEDLKKKSYSLSDAQEILADRTAGVIEKIIDLPEGQQKFQKEIRMLTEANQAMDDATRILEQQETGAPAIAAETEAIEKLLQAKRSKGGGGSGGGGGGGSSGGGNGGNISSLATLGEGDESQAKIEKRDTVQATGKAGTEHPAEFKRGLDRYFELLESNQ